MKKVLYQDINKNPFSLRFHNFSFVNAVLIPKKVTLISPRYGGKDKIS